ncbi:RNA-dependent RNA polymerase [Partitivirus-like Culex mosquito virus]|nr:RNA-dependent RNA polymerase [Partitivirus-like Culex mosquito virus]
MHRACPSVECIRADVDDYNRQYVQRVQNDTYLAVLESVRKDFVPEKPLVPWTLGRCQKQGIPKDKSPGLPWRERGYKTKREVLEDPAACNEIHKYWSLVGKGYRTSSPDTMVYFRSQICGVEANKIRATWGYPMAYTLEEGRFVYPYLEWIRHTKKDVPVAYGVEMATGGMAYIDNAYQDCKLADPTVKTALLDWRKFDKCVPAWLIRDAFEIMLQCFTLNKVLCNDDHEWKVDPAKTRLRWKKVVNYFINTPFILPSGERYQKEGGVPSGSTWTNIIDTIINAIVVRYCMFHVTGSMPMFDVYMGDDSCVFISRGIDLTEFSKIAHAEFGFILNEKKSYVTGERTNITFLGYHNYYGKPVRDGDFLLASFIYPERFHGTPDPAFTAMRAVGQMWSSLNGVLACKWLDLIEDMQTHFGFDVNWFADHVKQHPGALKYLRLTGFDPTLLHVPQRKGWIVTEVEPPPVPRRAPSRRRYDMLVLYQSYFEHYLTEDQVWSSFRDERVKALPVDL